ncbi:MAG: MFS transporter [Candidatus Promineifilaceae bacterium]|nr:MFS transporter [Candidatus Promineifilaceae bacterium]
MQVKKRRYPRWQMILYASGSLAVALSYQAFATYIQFLYIDILGLPARWVGLSWSVYGLWNAINDPLAGHWSDRTDTRWGRRIPWIAVSFLPLAITFYFLWTPPAAVLASSERNLLLYFLALVFAFDLLWTIVVMNWTSLFPEMIPDERQRATVSAWREIFSLVGVMVGVALPPVLAGEDWSGRGTVALLLSVTTALFFGLSLAGSRERPAFRRDNPLPFRKALRVTLGNRDFLHFLGANLAIQFIIMMLSATAPFYTKYVLRIQGPLTIQGLGMTLDAGTQTSLFLAAAFVVALPAMALWTTVAHRQGVWRALRMACLLSAGSLVLFFLPNDFYSGVLVTAIFGVSLAGLMMLINPLVADLVDADELETGARREGMYFGMNGFVIRFAFTFQGLITGTILTASGYVAPSAGVLYPAQPVAALSGMRWMIGGIPALAALLAFFLLGSYSLRGERLVRVQKAVADLHERKETAVETTEAG